MAAFGNGDKLMVRNTAVLWCLSYNKLERVSFSSRFSHS
jgi:hypothetical protein